MSVQITNTLFQNPELQLQDKTPKYEQLVAESEQRLQQGWLPLICFSSGWVEVACAIGRGRALGHFVLVGVEKCFQRFEMLDRHWCAWHSSSKQHDAACQLRVSPHLWMLA